VTIPQSVASRVGSGLVLVLAILAVVAVCTFLVTSYLGRGEKSTRGGANGAITPAAVCIPSTAPAQETQPTAGQIAALAADATSAATSDRACVD
jgi:hypothetical protein